MNPNASHMGFSKIVAMPTPSSWSQVYTAGSLFAVLSLSQEETTEREETLLGIGKETINTLEEEYFTLETKDLSSIQRALETTLQKIPADIEVTLLVAALVKDMLYVFATGAGLILVKRNGTLGILLETPSGSRTLQSLSGPLKDNDFLVLITKQFQKTVTNSQLQKALHSQNPTETAEELAGIIHKHENGQNAAAFILYKEQPDQPAFVAPAKPEASTEEPMSSVVTPKHSEQEPSHQSHPEDSEEKQIDDYSPQHTEHHAKKTPLHHKIKPLFAALAPIFAQTKKVVRALPIGKIKLTGKKKMFLLIALLLLILLVFGIFSSIQQREQEKTASLLQGVMSQAQKKYDEGQALMTLNRNLSRDDFEEAERILTQGKSNFKPGSKEEQQITEFLKKIEVAKAEVSGVNQVSAIETEAEKSPLLQAAIKNPTYSYFTQDDKNMYFANNSEVMSQTKDATKAKSIITNEDDWNELAGIGTFLNNIYILDKAKNQVLKFVASGSNYSSSNYFASGVSPDLSKAVAMAIDGSIWILQSDGAILKFTRGKGESFSLTGLDAPFGRPVAIATHEDSNNLYILDAGGGRIVVVDKKGAYVAQYSSRVLEKATNFDVDEKNKKVYVLSDKKVWTIDLK